MHCIPFTGISSHQTYVHSTDYSCICKYVLTFYDLYNWIINCIFLFFSQIQSDSELDTSTDLNAEVFSSLPRSFKFNRSRFSDEFADGRAKRRESFGFPSTRLDESSNLLRMRANPSLGSSEPNLSGSCVSNNLS